MQHVMVERPDYAELVEKIQAAQWVIMKNLPNCDDEDENGHSMCEVVHAHGEYAVVRPCYLHSEAFNPGTEVHVIQLSRWSEFFVEFHTDFYNFGEIGGCGPATHRIDKVAES